jgi:retron-type reverse transcriptase
MKEHSNEFFSVGIWTLRDRILQHIIKQAIFPIIEYQADPLSFAARPKRTAHQAIAFIYKHLMTSHISKKNFFNLSARKVNKEEYIRFSGKKAKFRTINIGKKKKKITTISLYILNLY